MIRAILTGLVVLACAGLAAGADETACVSCHAESTPNLVLDRQASGHHDADVGCDVCHGDAHSSAEDVHLVETVTANTCGACHDTQLEQLSRGEHAPAWASAEAMPATHALPMSLGPGMKGCGDCHEVGPTSTERWASTTRSGSGGPRRSTAFATC